MKMNPMDSSECVISQTRKRRFEIQGFKGFTHEELYQHRVGLRLPYYTCGTIVFLGLLFNNIGILFIALLIAFFGIFPPYHPVDYIYNYVIRHWIDKPKLPPRAPQGRSACLIATIMLGTTMYLLSFGFIIWGYIVGGTVITSAILVATMDICIPSMIYNNIFGKKPANLT